jgi:DNA modification methylase
MPYKLICDEASSGLSSLKEKSVHCCITSPPYFNLRDYNFSGQIGLEENPEEYIEKLIKVFQQVKRVLRDDGTLWVNIGDTYASKEYKSIRKGNLIGIPWMLAFAMRNDGWYLRSDIIWHKENPLPSGSCGKPIASHEYFFLFAQNKDYFYDAEATKENAVEKNPDGTFKQRFKRDVWTVPVASFKGSHLAVFPTRLIEPCVLAGTSEKGCCSLCGSPYIRKIEKQRYATRPGINNKKDLTGFAHRDSGRHLTVSKTIGWEASCLCVNNSVEPCTVLDPFSGASTTGVVALTVGRNFIGIDGNKEYVNISEERLKNIKSIL